MAGCQVIPEEDRLQPYEAPTERHVLLTEITGWRCPNCPEAAEIAYGLLERYPDNLVVVELHPSVNSFTRGSSYTSAAGDEYFRYLGGTATNPSPPSGVLNFTSGFLDRSLWATQLSGLLEEESTSSLQLEVQGDSLTRQVQVRAHCEPECNGQLLLWLVEDSIVGLQAKGSETVRDYVHNHVLRGSLFEDPWGETSTTGAFAGCTAKVDAAYNWHHCSVVGVLLNPEDKQVMDVIQIKLEE